MSFRPYFLELAEDYRKGTDSVTESEIAAQAADAKAAADRAVTAATQAAADLKNAAAAGADGTREMYDKEYVARLRREAEEHRKKADSLQSEKDATELKTLEANKEFEKIATHERSKREALEAQIVTEWASYGERLKRDQLQAVAEKHGLLDPDDIKNIDVASLDVDGQGRLVGADAAFEALKVRKPHYFKVTAEPAPQTLADPYSGLRRPPQPSPKPVTGGIDVNALTDAEFDAGWKTLGKFQRA